MVLLGDEAQVEARFSLFEDSANLDSIYVHGLCQTYHSLRNCFRHTQWNSKVVWVMSVKDRCMVCAKHTVGLEIVLDALDSAPR
jgi:hypothetical protein